MRKNRIDRTERIVVGRLNKTTTGKKIKIIAELLFLFAACAAGILSRAGNLSYPAGNAAVQEEKEKRIALTFDDGPSASYTVRLLDGLKERNIKASFFLIGKQAEKYPEIVKRIQKDGHLIGNHTYHHIELTKVSKEKEMEEIGKTNEVLEGITGEKVSFIRPPFGEWRKEILEDVELIPVLWDIDPLDWCTPDSGEIVRRVVTKAKENGIILLHDCYETSVEAALQIIDLLKEKGYEFVTVDELIME